MSPTLVRPLLHTVHLLTFAVLFATGVLLFAPTLRAAVTGGYSQVLRDAHRWGGVAFAALPLLLIARFGRHAFSAPAAWSVRAVWQALHTGITVVMGLVFTATGAVIWGERHLSESLVDAARNAHDWLTYAAAALVAAHLVEVGVAALGTRIRAAAGAPHSQT